jgi:hypothetical protein
MPRYTREIVRSLEAGPTPKLEIRGLHGSVKVRGEERPDVRIEATIHLRAATDEDAEDVIRAVSEGIYAEEDRVYARSPEPEHDSLFGALHRFLHDHGRLEIDWEVAVPRGASLSLNLVNGPVDVSGIDGNVSGHIVNGRFNLTDVGGDLRFHHVNAKGAVRGVGGSVDMHYTNGDLDVERVAGDVNLHLVNGHVQIADAGRDAHVQGVSGAFVLTGAVRGDVSMSNSHGRITLNVPPESHFRLDADSSLGSVTSELEVRTGGGDTGDAPRVSLHSETGSIELRALRQRETADV